LRYLVLILSLGTSFLLTACKTETLDPVEKLILDVFEPQPGETVLVMTDLPHGELEDSDQWQARREMAMEWHTILEKLGSEVGFKVHPLLSYPATGSHNAPLPDEGEMAGDVVHFDEIFIQSNIVVALTEFSATAPLIKFSQQALYFRAASMPMVHQGMMETALAADYQEVAKKCQVLYERLNRAEGAELQFSTGDQVYIDLRNRRAEIDDGQLHADKQGMRVINLPSGETYIAPYEGELPGQPSRTEGKIPMVFGDTVVELLIQENRVVEVMGDESRAVDELQKWFEAEPARRNIAELGLGCNDKAVIGGNILEDEKVLGVHLAVGRSDHIGGVIGVDDLNDPANVVHQDLVYPFGGDIEVLSLTLEYDDGTNEEIIRDGSYTVFSE
jgi:hypothetical protein